MTSEPSAPSARQVWHGSRAFVACGSSRAADCEAACRRLGLVPVLTLSRQQLLLSPGALRARVRESGAEVAVIYTRDWRRQELPQLLTLAVSAVDVPGERVLVEESSTGSARISPISRSAALTALGDPVVAFGAVAREARSLLRPARPAARRTSWAPSAKEPAIAAVWLGAPETEVGGSVTHIAGILSGFRELGFTCGLVAAGEPPPQLRAVIDDAELVAPLPPGARLTSDVERIASNAPVHAALERLVRRLEPAFVYQRHRPFLVAPLDAAHLRNLPFVLEWNSSEAWSRTAWNTTHSAERVFDPILERAERRVVLEADLVACVSDRAAEMARRYGPSDERVLTVPNGVDAVEIARLADESQGSRADPMRATIGWIGSFGPWHGAPVLIRALAHLPAGVEAIMIGDGHERRLCQTLARELGVGDRIQWTGSLAHDAAVRTLARCDVLASPHVALPGQAFFGSPTKIFEYMAIGRPIVASALEQIADVLTDGVTARLVPPGEERALAQAICAVLGTPDRGAQLGIEARRTAMTSHTWQHRAAAVAAALGCFDRPAGCAHDGGVACSPLSRVYG